MKTTVLMITTEKNKSAFVLIMGIIGIGGSFGVVLLALWSGKLILDYSVNAMTSLVGLCIISGVFATKFIPIIGEKIENDWMDKINKETSKKTESAIKLSTDYSSSINFAYDVVEDNNPKDIEDAIQRLLNLKSSFPKDRAVYILLGRLYRNLGKFNEAILVLREFIKNLNKDLSSRDHSTGLEEACGDAYYNIACYHALKASTEEGKERDRLIKEACQELERSLKIWPKNKEYATDDPDFDSIRELSEFSHLIQDQE